jgi:hypothetical protein
MRTRSGHNQAVDPLSQMGQGKKDTTNTMPLFAGRMMFEMGRM